MTPQTGPVPADWTDVHHGYGPVAVLSGFDLTAHAGELLVLLGASGAGKSTALRVLAGLEQPTRGTVRIGDRDVTRIPGHRRGVAMVFQDYALYPHLTVAENLGFGLRVRRVPRDQVRARVGRTAESLGLGGLLDRHPDQLSGGQQQRVALGRALVGEPAVLCLDEPLSNLDVALRHEARERLLDLRRRLGTTTVHVTHDQSEAMALGDRVAVLHQGRVEQVDVPQRVYDSPASVHVARLLGSPPMNLVGGDTATGVALGGGPGVLLGLRPEDLVLGDGGPLGAQVAAVEPLGSESIVVVHGSDGSRLLVRTPPRSALRAGEPVRVRADPDRTHRFDAATGRRLP